MPFATVTPLFDFQTLIGCGVLCHVEHIRQQKNEYDDDTDHNGYRDGHEYIRQRVSAAALLVQSKGQRGQSYHTHEVVTAIDQQAATAVAPHIINGCRAGGIVRCCDETAGGGNVFEG